MYILLLNFNFFSWFLNIQMTRIIKDKAESDYVHCVLLVYIRRQPCWIWTHVWPLINHLISDDNKQLTKYSHKRYTLQSLYTQRIIKTTSILLTLSAFPSSRHKFAARAGCFFSTYTWKKPYPYINLHLYIFKHV